MNSYWPLIIILTLLLIAGGMDYEDNVRAAEAAKAAQQYRHPNIEDYP
jgi:hypothetical protein